MKIRRPSKRTSIIVVISLIGVLVAGLYTWQSLRAWSSYEDRLMKEQATYQELKDTALNGDSADKRLNAIRALDDKLKKRSELCQISPLYGWQAAIVPPLKEGVKKCEDKVRRLGLVAVPLKALREYLEASAKVQDIIQDLNPGEALKEANWTTNGLERAKKAVTDLKQLSLKGDAAKLQGQATKLSDSLVVSWQNLIKANEAKDKTAFLTASAAVTQAYADFMALADTADTDIQTKVDAVVKEADKL